MNKDTLDFFFLTLIHFQKYRQAMFKHLETYFQNDEFWISELNASSSIKFCE